MPTTTDIPSKNLTLGVGLASAEGDHFPVHTQRIAKTRLLAMLKKLNAPDVILEGEGKYTNAAGDTFTEPCLSLVWYGRGNDRFFVKEVQRKATQWCQLFEQEAFALTIGAATIHTL